MTSSTVTNWIELFPALANLEEDAAQCLTQAAQVVDLPTNQYVFHSGDACSSFLLVLDGVVRVQICSENGREIILYRVDAGDSCVLTTACLLGNTPYSAEGVTESPVRAVAIPATIFHQMMNSSSVLRDFVFQSYGARLTNLMMLMQEVAFGRLDIRLARFLCKTADAQGELTMTHQKLAVELGSVREVISRQLKEFERHGLLKLNRGRITALDSKRLRAIGQDEH